MNIENTVHIPGFEDRFFIDVTDGTIYSQYKSKYGIKIVNLIKNIAVDYQGNRYVYLKKQIRVLDSKWINF